MDLIYMIPFFINKNKERYFNELKMANDFLESLQYCDYLDLIFYNQGPFSNEDLSAYLSRYNLKFKVLGSGKNDGIVFSRYIMTKYILQNYPSCKYVAEVHLDMIFTPNWDKPLIDFLEHSDEPFVSPRILSCLNNTYTVTGKTDPVYFPSTLKDKVDLLNSFTEDTIIEGFVHPAIHKLEILKEIDPYDIRFLTGMQGYEDDSILVGYSYYMGTKNKWRPKICFRSCVYHKVIGQRLNVNNTSTAFNRNLSGLKIQYGALGLKELARIHNGNKHFQKNYESMIVKKLPTDINNIQSFKINLLEPSLANNIYISRYFIKDDYTEYELPFNIPNEWWSRKYEYTWASKFVEKDDVSLDLACGLIHPFKFYLANVCNEVYACDKNDSINDNNVILKEVSKKFSVSDLNMAKSVIDKIKFDCLDIQNLNYKDDYFDKIYCISVLHLLKNEEVENGLNEIYRILKKDGVFILTIDIPTINLDYLINCILKMKFKFADTLIRTKFSNSIYSNLMGGIYCFRMVLTK